MGNQFFLLYNYLWSFQVANILSSTLTILKPFSFQILCLNQTFKQVRPLRTKSKNSIISISGKNKGYIATFSKFGNARAVMSYWAKLLKERVDWFKANQ